MSDQSSPGQDPVEVEPTDNSSATPVDLTQAEEVEKEMHEPER